MDYGDYVAPDDPSWAPHEDTPFGLDDQPTTCPQCGVRTHFEDEPGGGTSGGLATNNTCPKCHYRFRGDWDDFEEDN